MNAIRQQRTGGARKAKSSWLLVLIFMFAGFLFAPSAYAQIAPTLTNAALSGIISSLPPAVLSSLPAGFVASPTVTALQALPQSSINMLIQQIPGVPSIAGQLPSLVGALPTTLLNSIPSSIFSSLPTGSLSGILSGLPAGTLSSIPNLLNGLSSGTLSGILSGLPSTVLTSLPSTIFSGISSSVISGVLSSVPAGILGSIPNLLSGFSGGALSGILSGLSGSVLGSLPSTLFSNLGTGVISGILSGLPSGILGSIPNLLSGFGSGALSSILGGLSSSVLGSLPTSLFSGISSTVLSALPSGIVNAIPGLGAILGPLGGLFGGCGALGIGFGIGIYVPVYDAGTNSKLDAYCGMFKNYVSKFDSYVQTFQGLIHDNPDSIRNILAGNPQLERLYLTDTSAATPQWAGNGAVPNPANGMCETRDAVDNQPYGLVPWGVGGAPPKESPWTAANTSGAITVNNLTGIKVNYSVSLSCLLQEIVEWNKLSIFVDIHSLLKTYISDAQTKQLSQKLATQVSAANIAWSRQGIEHCETDIVTGAVTCSTYSVQNVQPNRYSMETKVGPRTRTVTYKITGDAATPTGSSGTCNPFKIDVGRDIANESRGLTESSYSRLTQGTQCSLDNTINPAQAPMTNQPCYDNYQQDFASPCAQYGGTAALFSMVVNPTNSRLGASTYFSSEQMAGVNEIEKEAEDKKGAKTLTDDECSGFAGDPTCDPEFQRGVTSGALVENSVQETANLGLKQSQEADSYDRQNNNENKMQTVDTNTLPGGYENYDTIPMSTSNPDVNLMVREFKNVIDWGYFDLQYGTRRWAEAAMLMIYDNMAFTSDYATEPTMVIQPPTITSPADPYGEYPI